MGTLLQVKDLQTHFFTQDGVVKAVNGVSFSLDEGETLGIVGESGCGKSVTVLSIMRLIPNPPGKIVGGQVLFDGEDLLKVDDEEIRRVRGNKIAMIFQDPMTSLNPVLTICRQITESLELHLGMNKDAARKRSIELLELVGIPEAAKRIDDYPHQFSGGMRQRVMIAMALTCNPQLLIADEPTTALDVTIQAQIIDLVKRLQQRTRHGGHLDHPRPGRGGRHVQARHRHVRRQHRRAGAGGRALRQPAAPLHAGPAALHPPAGRRAQEQADPHRGPAAGPDRDARHVPLRPRCQYVQDICRHEAAPARARWRRATRSPAGWTSTEEGLADGRGRPCGSRVQLPSGGS